MVAGSLAGRTRTPAQVSSYTGAAESEVMAALDALGDIGLVHGVDADETDGSNPLFTLPMNSVELIVSEFLAHDRS